MALGSQVGWKAEDGAADDAWNDNTPVPASVPAPATIIATKLSYSKVVKADTFVNKNSNLSEADADRCHFLELPPALILEIFQHLDARALCLLSCACVLFRRLASDSHGWKNFYCERWGLPASPTTGALSTSPEKSWRELYMAREERCKVLMGRFQMDMLHGHTAAVRCIRLLPAANLVITAGYDQVVRVWNLEEGLPLVCSRPLEETLRAIAVDMELLAVAGSNAVIRIWRAIPECPQLFDVAGIWGGPNSKGAETCLYGHTGPITCLGLDATNIYSGSWDMSIRVWDRVTLRSGNQLLHNDWVWALVPRGRRILSTAGSHVYSWDIETGHHRMRAGAHVGQAYAVQGSRSGDFVFTGGEDGAVRMFDDRLMSRQKRAGGSKSSGATGDSSALAVWMPQRGAIHSLAFEDPWLVAASADGSVAMMDVRQIMEKASASGKRLPSSSMLRSRTSTSASQVSVGKTGEETVQRFLVPGTHQCLFSVDLGADRVVSGGDEMMVRIWDFSQAIEIERSIQASRRNSQRSRRRKQAVQAPAVDQKPLSSELTRGAISQRRPEVVASTSTKAAGSRQGSSSGWVTLGRIRKSQTVGGS
ncbi:hypothetical protein M758_4G103300 [Ceratodon purpureus]|uniref:F-box domain-containing protein n=1 Tax=Ceratodon purpureus TaxID=3225 RepID=A0A8T0IAN3_CERPU|nr:hypothetical protein KC19_4G104900 [Ceratodon purpureus]KAG0618938.1 hypothetical protein M758_4G103300 [Ceratodon purpureus]